jgi:hypothetical protein
MPQNIAFQALVRTPSKKLAQLQDNAQGLVYAAPPGTGNSWFVNETTGSDTNAGSAAAPFASLTAAQTAAVANNGDVVYLMGTSHQTATLVWAKNGVSFVCLQSPSNNDRSRISSADTLTQTQATALTPLVSVTAQGCLFSGISAFLGFTSPINPPTAPVCWADTGGRNTYTNCDFFGGGDAASAAEAGMRSLTLGGANGENKFDGCTIGLDTITRATNANASLEFVANAESPRNVFRNCIFQALSTLAGNVHVLVSAAGIDRYAYFDRCAFINAINTGASAMSVAFTVTGTAGLVLLNDCVSVGATVYATGGPIYVQGAVPTGTTSGLAVAAT